MEKAESEDAAIEHVLDRLTSRFPSVPADVIEAAVDEVHASFDEAAVRDFVPIIVEHDVKERLRDAGETPEPPLTEPQTE
jgi:hypothetical protein